MSDAVAIGLVVLCACMAVAVTVICLTVRALVVFVVAFAKRSFESAMAVADSEIARKQQELEYKYAHIRETRANAALGAVAATNGTHKTPEPDGFAIDTSDDRIG